MISVIIPAYNAGAYIKAALLSVFRQNVEIGFEILVCDDGSVDDTHQVVDEMSQKHPAIKLFRHAENLGTSAARNLLLEKLDVNSNYVIFLDADDILANGAIEKSLAVLRANPLARFVTGMYQVVPTKALETGEPVSPEWPTVGGAMLSAGMFKTDLIREVGCFDTSFDHGEDADFRLRIAEITNAFVFHDYIFFYYRRHANNVTRDFMASQSGIRRAMLLHAMRRRKNPALLGAAGMVRAEDMAEIERALKLYE